MTNILGPEPSETDVPDQVRTSARALAEAVLHTPGQHAVAIIDATGGHHVPMLSCHGAVLASPGTTVDDPSAVAVGSIPLDLAGIPARVQAMDRSGPGPAVQTAIPPSCEPCADRVTKDCLWLRDGHVRLRVREAVQIGARGTLHPRPGHPGRAQGDALVLYDSPDARYGVTRHAVRELARVNVAAVGTAASTPSGTACPYADVALAGGGSA